MKHYTVSAYNKGCRCDDCKRAVSEYKKRRRQAGALIGINLYDQHWRDQAACGGMSTEAFFPEQPGRPGDPHRAAIEICATCPVRTECLEYALSNDERWGIWGGKTPRQRLRIAADRRRALRQEVS